LEAGEKMAERLNEMVRSYWEQQPCGTDPDVIGHIKKGSLAWSEKIEEHRYNVEAFIHAVAQFTRYHGKKILEIGVGAGTDHLQWVRAGAECYGVDLTDAAIKTTKARLAIYGFKSNLQCLNAEILPFPDESFDLVYSWGVIHHSEHPERIIREIRRVLRPGGDFTGMMYNRHSLVALRLWVKHSIKERNCHSLADVIWNHVESVGTKAYTVKELKELFSEFSRFSAIPFMTTYDKTRWPVWISKFFPDEWGWFIAIRAKK
jgi:ubiquinone/menaquinone biosynthesis C-methylase UbiE